MMLMSLNFVFTHSDSDDESIWPRKERISTYFTKVLNWRPPCLFGAQPESEDDEITEQQIIMTELDKIPLPCEIGKEFLKRIFSMIVRRTLF